MKSHVDYLLKKVGEIRKIRIYALVFALLSIFCAAIAYGSTGDKEILSTDERAWLTKNQSRIVLGVETGYAPFVFIDSKDQPAGLAQDYIQLIESKLGVHFNQRRFSSLSDIFEKVHSGEVQIVNAVTSTPERSKFLTMTEPFIFVPNVILVNKDRSGQMAEYELSGLKVSLVKSYAITEHMTNRGLHFIPDLVPDDLTALFNASFGRSDAAIIDLATASYLISSKGITNLRVAGEVSYDIKLAIGTPINEPELHSILQKGLNAISNTERQEIKNRWINSTNQNIFKERQFWIILGSVLAVALAIFTIILIWNRTLRRQVAKRTAQLEAANKELEEFSYSMSHDMRTPLRALDGFSKILLEDYGASLDDEGKRLLKVLRDNAQRMGRLVDDILHFLSMGRRKIECSSVDIAKLASEIFTEFKAANPERHLRLEIGAVPLAWGDREMIRELLQNLLSNAIKFSPVDAEAVIELAGAVEDDENVFSVKDQGIGFNMSYADKLFRVFERVHPTGQYEGSGIGLAIVKRIITRHGGRVWAEGKINEGATIYFTLPTKEKNHE